MRFWKLKFAREGEMPKVAKVYLDIWYAIEIYTYF